VCVTLDPKHPKKILGQVIPGDLRAGFERAAPSEVV
jgi:hypothetical protein